MAPVEDILAALRRAGGRITPARRATVETLVASTDRHVNAEEIVRSVRSRHPDVAESTIYRTLSTLEELGLISHLHLDHGPATFHLAEHPHRHLVCRRCHAVVEIPLGMFEELERRLEERYGFRIEDEHFAIAGVCAGCR